METMSVTWTSAVSGPSQHSCLAENNKNVPKCSGVRWGCEYTSPQDAEKVPKDSLFSAILFSPPQIEVPRSSTAFQFVIKFWFKLILE